MRVLVTAGPTREAIDDVRFLTSGSTGRMGFAIAAAARDAGHDVTLILGPVPLSPPEGVTVVPVVSVASAAGNEDSRKQCADKQTVKAV